MLLVLALLTTLPGEGRVLTPLDALHKLPWTPGRVVHYGDWNGDGVPDVAMERQPTEGTSIEVLCSMDARVLAVLWKGPRLVNRYAELPWALGDVDGDGSPDLLVGMPEDSTNGDHAGAVQVVSGATTQTLAVTYGSREAEAYGSSVAFLGDVDQDGLGDYAVAAPGWMPDTWRELRESLEVTDNEPLAAAEPRLAENRTLVGGWIHARSGRDHHVIWSSRPGLVALGRGSSATALGDIDGDCTNDLVVGNVRGLAPVATLLSGRHGRVIGTATTWGGPVGCAGDLDGDGTPDLFLDEGGSGGRGAATAILSGATLQPLGTVAFPDISGENGVTIAVGDVDLDGYDDLAVGESNYNLIAPDEGADGIDVERLRGLSLREALALESNPRTMVPTESGCMLVVSGRTRRPILGVWGRPGSRDGMGLSACAIPDVSGDGAPDLVIGGSLGTFVFEGPGPVRW